jgi:acyl-CoA hydrolase
MSESSYLERLVSVEQALSLLKDGQQIVTAMAVSEPTAFFRNLAPVGKRLKDLTISCANPGELYDCFQDRSLVGHIVLQTMFLTHVIRKQHGHGVVHYIPQHLSHWSKNLQKKASIDIFWGSCTPPDDRGFVNLGPSSCYEAEIVRKAKMVILEINPNLPYCHGATHVPVSAVNYFIHNQHPLQTVEQPEITEKNRTIANYVERLIEDESTIQLGIGSIPNAIGEALSHKKELGVHTEMINSTIMDLYQKGVITGTKKTLWPEKIVGSFALGTSDLYKFLDRNPVIEFQPSSLVNDPYRLGRNHRMKSINTAVEIDITGQVCSESVGHRELSGVGGASDTHIGAQLSPHGRGIIAIHASTTNDMESKIVFELALGAKVSISRNDIDTVVTEYGIAELAGESVATRVKKLVAIAHPKFRDELLFKAKEVGYI